MVNNNLDKDTENCLGKFLEAIFRVRSGPCFDAHAQIHSYDFSISSKVNIFSTFSARNKYKMFAKCQILSNFKINVQKQML